MSVSILPPCLVLPYKIRDHMLVYGESPVLLNKIRDHMLVYRESPVLLKSLSAHWSQIF